MVTGELPHASYSSSAPAMPGMVSTLLSVRPVEELSTPKSTASTPLLNSSICIETPRGPQKRGSGRAADGRRAVA